jgi:hypothetical protein
MDEIAEALYGKPGGFFFEGAVPPFFCGRPARDVLKHQAPHRFRAVDSGDFSDLLSETG